ncbi:MAG: hypothetical protein ACOX1S_05350 [Anaerostipes sp.]|nr:hypothetical protein [Anaerostipes sp.]
MDNGNVNSLIELVKKKLNITWEDEDTNQQINFIIEDSIHAIDHKLGIKNSECDYSKPGQERLLFENYCMYEWNNCLNEFDANYSNEIFQLRARWEVYYATKEE